MKVYFIIILKNNLIFFVIIIFFSLFACNSNNEKVFIKEKKKFINNDTSSLINVQFKDTLKKNKILSFNNNEIITDNGNRKFLFKKTYAKNKITLLKIENGDDFFPKCNGQICAIFIYINNNNKLEYIKVPLIYEEDLKLSFKDDFNRFYFLYYLSPDGPEIYYLFDTQKDKIYKTEYIAENEAILKKSFNYINNTFYVINRINDKKILKHFSLIYK